MSTKTNLIFLGCNYSNKKVKTHFNNLKTKLEKEWPIQVVLIDKEKGKGSRDLWKEIKSAIDESALAIFDVSAFRPNVVLELGYALATKNEENVIITFDDRKLKKSGNKPDWLLSDIGHLHQVRYCKTTVMENKIEENLSKVPSVARYKELCSKAKKASTTSHEKYESAALLVLHKLIEKKELTNQQIEELVKGTNIRTKTLHDLLKQSMLASRKRGRGPWTFVEYDK